MIVIQKLLDLASILVKVVNILIGIVIDCYADRLTIEEKLEYKRAVALFYESEIMKDEIKAMLQ